MGCVDSGDLGKKEGETERSSEDKEARLLPALFELVDGTVLLASWSVLLRLEWFDLK